MDQQEPDSHFENMHILVRQSAGNYALPHQNFRDFLAAVHLNQVVEVDHNAQASANAWERTPFSDRVVAFLAEWISESTVNRLLEAVRGKQIPAQNYFLFNLIQIIRKIKNDDLSGMDFFYIDLQTVRLNGARLSNGTHYARFCHSRIGHGTLIMQGHHDKLYYIAFLADGKQLVSISACELRIWDISMGRYVHEITEGIMLPKGRVAYNLPQFRRKFVTADGKEIVWIGEMETCRRGFIDLFSDPFQPNEKWKDEPYPRTREEKLKAIVQYRTTQDKAVIQKDGVRVSCPRGK